MSKQSSIIDEIKGLLDQLEAAPEVSTSVEASSLVDEGAVIVRDVVDYLQPLLTPYQAAFYWFMLRRSVFDNGGSLLRVSTRGLGKGVVKSSRSETVSQSQIKDLLAGLETLGAIRKEGEPNRTGTLYRVMVPDQIEACKALQASLQTVQFTPSTEAETDYYNVRENRRKIFERDAFICHYCSKQLDERTATLDHIIAVMAGGNNSLDNLVTACLSCNSRKNHRPLGDFLAEQDQT